ncbi:MAG: UDP-3-O-(3-hydroxymyristoyl)glucosamine N-acyltransferase [Synergistaceae bacterium]|nr:UDP-3-O-(3-hydroxymyristoyl)glucosamine N-acyltransferase [Synergistaceae bacterium]
MKRDFETTLSELGEILGLEVVGDGTRLIRGVAPPEEGDPHTLCVVWDAKSLNVIGEDVPLLAKPEFLKGRPGLSAHDPREILPTLLRLFIPPEPVLKGVHPSAAISPEATVSEDAWVGPFCVVEPGASVAAGARLQANVYLGRDSHVGQGTVLEPHVTLMPGTRVGKNCLLHAGCVLGCDGFGFIPSRECLLKIPQVGNVAVGNEVEIGACTTIDRGTMGDTVIGDGTKIDNHVQIGHNVRIGKNCIVCSMSGVAGSSVVEDGVTVSSQVGITDHVRIGKGATLGGRSGVTNDIPPGGVVSGFPARSHNEARRAQVLAVRLPELYERLRYLERMVLGKPQYRPKSQPKSQHPHRGEGGGESGEGGESGGREEGEKKERKTKNEISPSDAVSFSPR